MLLDGRMTYSIQKNSYGGWIVVDEQGQKAPKPNGFNTPADAQKRADQLNSDS